MRSLLRKTATCFEGEISERKSRDHLRLLMRDFAADRAAELTGLQHNITLALCSVLYLRTAELARSATLSMGGREVQVRAKGDARKDGIGIICINQHLDE